jgi:hypothetical protein
VCHFLRNQCLWNHTNHVAVSGHHGIGDNSHEPHVRAAIDEPDTPVEQSRGQPRRRDGVLRPSPYVRSREDRDTPKCVRRASVPSRHARGSSTLSPSAKVPRRITPSRTS